MTSTGDQERNSWKTAATMAGTRLVWTSLPPPAPNARTSSPRMPGANASSSTRPSSRRRTRGGPAGLGSGVRAGLPAGGAPTPGPAAPPSFPFSPGRHGAPAGGPGAHGPSCARPGASPPGAGRSAARGSPAPGQELGSGQVPEGGERQPSGGPTGRDAP